MRAGHRTCYLAAAALLAGCTPPPEPEVREPASCAGVSRAPLSAVDRKIVGAAAPYEADGTLRARDAELAASQRARRQVAWHTVAKVLGAVPLAETLPLAELPTHIPAWQSWYDKDDLRRIFHRLYGDLPVEAKRDRAHFASADLDDTFIWNTSAVEELPTWPVDRYLAYLEAIDSEGEIAGLGGISRVSYSPAAARHILQSYPEVLGCHEDGAPPAQEVGPLVTTPVLRAAVTAEPCEARVVGSFAIGDDESLYATWDGEGDGTLTLSAGGDTCRAAPSDTCEIFGPATVDVSVRADTEPIRSVVSLTRKSTRPPWAGCLDEAFPSDAVVVKADYRRADFELTMPVYATSASALATRLGGDASWEQADGEADPPPSDIYTLTLPNGAHYRLAALHIMSKELDHWSWITLWWSPSPAEDFGADRPAAIEALGGPWSHYKMCAATAFEEGDPLASGGFDDSHPTLAAALAVTHAGVGAATWCSNPYLEQGHDNAGTNCIGCHQHGGTELSSEDILTFADRGRSLLRNNFPADYSWATEQGDELAQLFADAELYFLGPP